MPECPICSMEIAAAILERHVNSCLDSQETPRLKRKNAFSSLGLQKRKTPEKRSPSLTSLLLEERRRKGKEKDEKEIKNEEEINDNDQKDENQTDVNQNENQPDVNQNEIQSDENQKDDNGQKYEHIQYLDDLVEVDQANVPDQNDMKDISITNDTNNATTNNTNTNSSNSTTNINNTSNDNTTSINTTNVNTTNVTTSTLPSIGELRRLSGLPLAQILRPKTLLDFYGQEKLLGTNGLLRNIVHATNIPSFLLWGPPGVGKTSLARIIARSSGYKFVEVLGSESNAKQLRECFSNAENEKRLTGRKTLLFLDEIHRFNKAVQDLLLPVIERGVATVVGATTDNPSFTLNNALLSRMHTFVMEPLNTEALIKVLSRALLLVNRIRKHVHGLHFLSLRKDAMEYLAELAMGDSRVVLNLLETIHAYFSAPQYSMKKKEKGKEQEMEKEPKLMDNSSGVINLTAAQIKPLLASRNFQQLYDRHGDGHYDNISAFHKAVRGSDADATMFYLTKMLVGGEDPLFIMRRMIVIASEDVGLRDSSCLPFAVAAKEALEFVGMPEGEIVLAHCAIKLARAPKSKKSYRALRATQAFLLENPHAMQLPVPIHLRNAPTGFMKDLGYGETYRHNPDYVHGVVHQTYLPPELQGKRFVGELHNGRLYDPEVDKEEYDVKGKIEEEYEEFKREKKREMRENWIENEEEEVNNFDAPYDEFLSPGLQPRYEGDEIELDTDED